MAVLVRERFLCSPFLPLVVRTARTQQQVQSILGPLFLHAQSHPLYTTRNEDKAVSMGVLKRDVYCHWTWSYISETLAWGWHGILGEPAALRSRWDFECAEINPLPQSWWDSRDVKGEVINVMYTWGICWSYFLLKGTVLVPEGSPEHSMPVAIHRQDMRDCLVWAAETGTVTSKAGGTLQGLSGHWRLNSYHKSRHLPEALPLERPPPYS